MNTMRSATLLREAHLVGDDDHGHARAGEVDHHVEHLGDHLGIERGGRLVEQHHPRLHAQRAGDGDALLLAARELAGALVGLLGDAHAFEIAQRPRLGLGPGACARASGRG
jgi:hypothetical protein